ncbi:MAG: PEP-CTERM sorting domain-containing protein [Myxococcales bacterium]|nr:PEP-CTERM sorting domain-containing protein [Myxococcales bacterium]
MRSPCRGFFASFGPRHGFRRRLLGPPSEVPIPEPGAAVVFGLGALLVAARRRR